MAPDAASRGTLIALDGASGTTLRRAAREILGKVRAEGLDAGISSWDASGIFYDLRHRTAGLAAARPRTLVLLYAADLAFRLRWDIRPALEEGKCVIAAPYVASAIALGKAARLPKRWLLDLFRFAPRPTATYCVAENGVSVRPGGEDGADGFVEFCCKELDGALPQLAAAALRSGVLSYLATLGRLRRCTVLQLEGRRTHPSRR